jgi:hypothetical protein
MRQRIGFYTISNQTSEIEPMLLTTQIATGWKFMWRTSQKPSSLRLPPLIVLLALLLGCSDSPTPTPEVYPPETKVKSDRFEHWCNLAEAVQTELYIAEVGSLFGWRDHVCGERNVYKVDGDQVLVMAHYLLTFGPVSYTVVFDARESASPSVLCESVLLECLKRPEITAIVFERLAAMGHPVDVPSDVWNETLERALWAYGADVGLTHDNANLELVSYALMTGIIQTIK